MTEIYRMRKQEAREQLERATERNPAIRYTGLQRYGSGTSQGWKIQLNGKWLHTPEQIEDYLLLLERYPQAVL